jgi:hypothetical protein
MLRFNRNDCDCITQVIIRIAERRPNIKDLVVGWLYDTSDTGIIKIKQNVVIV